VSFCTLINLICDHCGNRYPCVGVCPAPVDGAIITIAELRHDAKEAGWGRVLTHAKILRDLCPRCLKQFKERPRK
jgi:hypothetical protein